MRADVMQETTPAALNLRLAKLLGERRAVLVPGAANALSARIVEDLGFEALYVTGAGISNTTLALPDLGFLGLSDIFQHTAAIRQATSLPLIVDADTGFGNALNVHHTVRALEAAGANAVQLEDQVMPKKCGHFASKAVVSRTEAVERVQHDTERSRSQWPPQGFGIRGEIGRRNVPAFAPCRTGHIARRHFQVV